jgi:nitroreductase
MSQRASSFGVPSGIVPAAATDPVTFLETRRSVAVTALGEPAPSSEELRRMLTIASRVPDHGSLEPWRFIVIDSDSRQEAGQRLEQVFLAEDAATDSQQREKFAGLIKRVFTHATLVVIVVSRTDPTARIPVWEQELSSGAVCMNLLHAAGALGFAGSWLTGWAAYSDGARRALGVGHGEKIAGIIHIGTPKETPADRKRPNVEALTTRWSSESPETT